MIYFQPFKEQVATVAGIEPAANGFGDRRSAITSRSTWVERPDSNWLQQGHNLSPIPSGSPKLNVRSSRTRRTDICRIAEPGAVPRTLTELPALQGQVGHRPHGIQTGAGYGNRTHRLCLTKAAFGLLNFPGTTWRSRWGSNPHRLAYEASALPLVLRDHGGCDGTRTRKIPADNRVPCLRASHPKLW